MPATDYAAADEGGRPAAAGSGPTRRTGTWWARRSLRARLTAAATVVIIVGMAGAAVLLVLRLHASLLANLDTAVVQQVQTVGVEAARGQLLHPLPTSEEGAAAVQVIGADGRVLTSSANIDGEGRLFTFPGGRTGVTLVRTVSGSSLAATYRVAALTTATPAGPVTVYAGLPTTGVAQSVTGLIGALAVGLPVVIVLLAVVGWLLVGRALRPVEAMRRQAAAIPGTDLHRRLDPPPADDELGRLAATLNELLARIETDAGRQRQFVADAAHELRSPLAALRTQLEVATRHPGQIDAKTLGADLLADTVRLSRLVDDLLHIARLDANPHPHRQAVDLDDLLLEEVRRASGRGHRIDTTGVFAGRVLGDPHSLSRVMQNLLDNALRHAASTVALQLDATESTVTLIVADDGPGIPAADRDRVFERFTRLDDARNRDAGGSGLGLAIVRDVVTAHGGRVHVEGNHPGARFTVVLPAAQN